MTHILKYCLLAGVGLFFSVAQAEKPNYDLTFTNQTDKTFALILFNQKCIVHLAPKSKGNSYDIPPGDTKLTITRKHSCSAKTPWIDFRVNEEGTPILNLHFEFADVISKHVLAPIGKAGYSYQYSSINEMTGGVIIARK